MGSLSMGAITPQTSAVLPLTTPWMRDGFNRGGQHVEQQPSAYDTNPAPVRPSTSTRRSTGFGYLSRFLRDPAITDGRYDAFVSPSRKSYLLVFSCLACSSQ
jgi:hypothetical protein